MAYVSQGTQNAALLFQVKQIRNRTKGSERLSTASGFFVEEKIPGKAAKPRKNRLAAVFAEKNLFFNKGA